jgi:hypothetical protein
VRRYRPSLLGLVLTLKLASWQKAAQIPGILDQLRNWGFTEVRAVQLFHHRQEILVLGLMPEALRRRGEL